MLPQCDRCIVRLRHEHLASVSLTRQDQDPCMIPRVAGGHERVGLALREASPCLVTAPSLEKLPQSSDEETLRVQSGRSQKAFFVT